MGKVLAVLMLCVDLVAAQHQPSDWLLEANTPESAKKVFAAKKLGGRYTFSFHLNPFYVRGDFNGDGKTDMAILVREKKTNKAGIAVIHSGTSEAFILGAGNEIGNGGDNFDWMDIWYVEAKSGARRGAGAAARGESLHVEKSESASALISWDGKKYVWHQQGN
jgi:hypothetical protein